LDALVGGSALTGAQDSKSATDWLDAPLRVAELRVPLCIDTRSEGGPPSQVFFARLGRLTHVSEISSGSLIPGTIWMAASVASPLGWRWWL